MLSIGKLGAGQERYYLDKVAEGAEDYYSGEGEAEGYWLGDGADFAPFRRPGAGLVDIAGKFGDNLARARRAADVTQEELSIRASVHRTEVSQLERGLRVPRIDTLIKLASSLEVDPEELLAGIKWSPGDVRIGNFRETPPGG